MFRPSRPKVALIAALGAMWAFPALGAAQTGPAIADPGTTGDDATAEEVVPVVRIDGRGHGHGVGLSQWGAHTMAQQGYSAAEILSTFYPGTHLGSGGGEIAVRLDHRSVAEISFPAGGEIRSGRDGSGDAAGFPVQVAAGATVTVERTDAGYEVTGAVVGMSGSRVMAPSNGCPIPGLCPTTTSTPSTSTTTPEDTKPDDTTPEDTKPDDTTPDDTGPDDTGPDDTGPDDTGPDEPAEPGVPTSPQPVWAIPSDGGTVTAVGLGRTYRGVLEISGALDVINHVDVESYLRGMIEVPGHWPPAAVQAQTVAARTFALRAMATSGSICDTDACQVYLGVDRESAGLDAAVAATRGKVVMYGDGLAATFFSASAGGVSATPIEGFGNDTQVPYLQAVEHPDTHPQPWSVQYTPEEIGRRFGYPGTATEVRIDETGPSGRAVSMSIDGDVGPVPLDPQVFRSKLDLRSTLYTVTMAMSDGSKIPAPPEVTSTTRGPDAMSGVQAPVASEPILFAVRPRTAGSMSWPWPTAAAAAIAAVTAGGVFCFSRLSGRVSRWSLRRR